MFCGYLSMNCICGVKGNNYSLSRGKAGQFGQTNYVTFQALAAWNRNAKNPPIVYYDHGFYITIQVSFQIQVTEVIEYHM